MKKYIFILILAIVLIGILFFTFMPDKNSIYRQVSFTPEVDNLTR